MSSIEFGKTKEGKTVTKYLLKNKNGMEVSVMDLGATIVSVLVPDRNGVKRVVVLGYDTPQEYQDHTCYFGAVIGRNANRIGGAKIVLGDREYQLEKNDNGNNLHSGKNGFHAVIWSVEQQKEDEITFSYLSKDLEQDFPGNMTAKVTYTVTDDNELSIAYEAVSDQTTVANFTNHAYFNLNGHDSGCMENQELEILASYYTPVKDGEAIPTGDVEKVAGTPMDFRKMKKIGQDVGADVEQLKFVGGYDTILCSIKLTGQCSSQPVQDQKNPVFVWTSIQTVSVFSCMPEISLENRLEKTEHLMIPAMHSAWRHNISQMQ